MFTFDIPINIRVNADTEDEAENHVSGFMQGLLDGGALTRPFIEWDFVEFVSEDDDGVAIGV